jgi:lactate dehydrogenase-like 2-hydroxyacid dehydrogenase
VVIDEAVLMKALESGKVVYVGLYVYEQEAYIGDESKFVCRVATAWVFGLLE